VTHDQATQTITEGQASTPMTKTEAIRQAIAVLGSQAQVPQILDYVQEHFGIGTQGPTAEPAAGSPSAPETAEQPPASPSGKSATRRSKPKDRPSPP